MIEFNSQKTFYKTPFGAVPRHTDLSFRIRITDGRSVASACLVLSSDEGEISRVAGASDNKDEKGGKSLYQFSLRVETIGLFFYHFEVTYQADGNEEATAGDQTRINSESNDAKGEPIPFEKTPGYQLTVYSEDFQTPDWLKSGLMYQIFPDRFARSDAYIAPEQNKRYVKRSDWGGIPNGLPDENGIVQNNDFFGGNLRGIIEKLNYLEELGVTVIYLNPIFEAYSNHRYDTADYKKIDPMLGTEEDFRELCRCARARGIRIILDGVFNHTGSDSLYFNKTGRFPVTGAYQSNESPYYNWYRFINHPDEYESWWGIDTLPHINETEPSYLDFIARSEDSVIRHWMRQGASGFRLDVADELPDEFLEAVRLAVKEEDPDGALIGEVWEDASNKISYGSRRAYFQGRQLDSVMNYPLKNGVIDYLIHHHNGKTLENLINSLWENYPQPAFSSLMNLLGTHDTPRILTVLSDEGRGEEYSRQRLFLAWMIISFMPGIPCVYYGDEIGMAGGKDPYNRLCFEPERGNQQILRFYRRLNDFTKKITKLQNYVYQPRSAEGSFYSFSRTGTMGRLIVAVNSGSQDCLVNLAMKEGEHLQDHLISGTVLFERQGVYRIKENSGITAYIVKKNSSDPFGIVEKNSSHRSGF
ncbi:glycoside hydrolase family 13 protein [Anoxybacterium hadale]|uniref:glycoside hydrolase family 13 protein n=1 Tax=Anoxybacterium hadale TaxID=3408580 RepID=UPI003B00F161